MQTRAAEASRPERTDSPVAVENARGQGAFVVVCEHASNFIPREFASLGLPPAELLRHIAWDPGAIEVARGLATRLDAALVHSGISRLVADCNRPIDAPDLVPEISETTAVPGNTRLSEQERRRRISLAHAPFHAALESLLDERLGRGLGCAMVTVHSFTPVYRGVPRPWQVGIVHDSEERLSQPLIAALRADAELAVGDNQPYAPADRVYYTLERHARSRGLACVMIELRNDVVADAASQQRWASRLAGLLAEIAASGEVADATA